MRSNFLMLFELGARLPGSSGQPSVSPGYGLNPCLRIPVKTSTKAPAPIFFILAVVLDQRTSRVIFFGRIHSASAARPGGQHPAPGAAGRSPSSPVRRLACEFSERPPSCWSACRSTRRRAARAVSAACARIARGCGRRLPRARWRRGTCSPLAWPRWTAAGVIGPMPAGQCWWLYQLTNALQ
jgi:hypothetical protein